MRIAYLTQSYPPMISGAAQAVEQTARAMAQRQHTVLVIAASDGPQAYEQHEQNLDIARLSSFRNPLRVGQRLLNAPRTRTLQLLHEFQPDIIHVHEPVQLGKLALEYAKHTGTPVLLTAHQLPWFIASYLPKVFKPFVESLLWSYACTIVRHYTRVITPTATIAKIIKEKTGVRPQVIGYGVDLHAFSPLQTNDLKPALRANLQVPGDGPIILHVGRLDADKNVRQVLAGTCEVLKQTQAHLLIAGDGREKPHLMRMCSRLGIQDRVHFTGFVPPSQLPDIYRIADVFVTASEIETQGIVLHEAAASGLPIVAVNATCISEIVHDNKNGFLVAAGDSAALSRAMLQILQNPGLASRMGVYGRQLVGLQKADHTWESHEALYTQVAKETGNKLSTRLPKSMHSKLMKPGTKTVHN